MEWLSDFSVEWDPPVIVQNVQVLLSFGIVSSVSPDSIGDFKKTMSGFVGFLPAQLDNKILQVRQIKQLSLCAGGQFELSCGFDDFGS